MNIFKGLLFLHGYANPADYQAELDDQVRKQFGARTADRDFAVPLGNKALSQRWLGIGVEQPRSQSPQAGCIAGGCG